KRHRGCGCRSQGPPFWTKGSQLVPHAWGPIRKDRDAKGLTPMLTGNLVRARIVKGRVAPYYIRRDDPNWLEVAESLLLIFRNGTDRTRGELQDEIEELIGEGVQALAHRGLAKVLEDRAEFEVVADVPPELVR